MKKKADKITVVGAGAIGATVVYTLMIKELAKEIVLVNRNQKKAEAKITDMSHCSPLTEGVKMSCGNLGDSRDSDIIVITTGVLPSETGTRMDVLASNIEIYKSIIPQIAKESPNAVIIVVTNPLDVMTYVAYKLSGFPASRVIGSGTLLDSMRFQYILGQKFNINPSNVEALVIGEHGDSMVPIWSGIKFSGMPINEYLKVHDLAMDFNMKLKIIEETKRAGWNIRLGNEHSCYGISRSVVKIIESIVGVSTHPIPVSTLVHGDYKVGNIFLSLPTIFNGKGIEKVENLPLNNTEMDNLMKSAEILDGYIVEADNLL